MLKKENRLKSRYEYNTTRKHGTSYKGSHAYYLVLEPRNYNGPTKIGIVTSRKVHKSAVKRNRIKRLYREAIREALSELPKNLWIVIQPRSHAVEKTYEEISTDFNKTLQEIFVTN